MTHADLNLFIVLKSCLSFPKSILNLRKWLKYKQKKIENIQLNFTSLQCIV